MLKHVFTRATRHLYPDKVNGKVYKAGGLKPHKKDARDFRYGSLMGWSLFGSYTPQHQRLVLPTISTKDQSPNNSCTQDSGTLQTEKNTELSEESLSCFAKEAGVISGNGFSSLREIQKVIQKSGIAEKKLLNNSKGDWDSYSSPKNLTPTIRDNAKNHKTQSYYLCSNKDERLKAMDDGHKLHAGMDWYSGYNMSGGFAYPWLIKSAPGVLVGGHAITMIGYDMNYQGMAVYIFKNSYGVGWGDNKETPGMFYVSMDFYDKYGHETYAQIPVTVDTATFLNQHQWSFVKSSDPTKKAIYQIIGNKKYPFNDWVTFLSYGGTKNQIEEVPDLMMENIETGEAMEITASPNWEILKQLVQPDNYKLVLEQAKLNQ